MTDTIITPPEALPEVPTTTLALVDKPAKWTAPGAHVPPFANKHNPTLAELNAAKPPVTPPSTKSVVGPQHEIPETVDPLLVDILSWGRTHESIDEYRFCSWLREHIKTVTTSPVLIMKEAKGAMSTTIPRPDGKLSTVLFSCHVDTVDGNLCTPGVRKKLNYDPVFGHIMLDTTSTGGCLGADDGVGIWIMLKMIERKVPGTYLFHRGEECHGVSAKAMAKNYEEWLKNYEVAAAFDRPRDNEIITHQGGQECASNKFAQALCERLNAQGMDFKPSDRGVYTDTKEYRKIIPECINIGVGYWSQHGRQETLDYAHAVALLDASCAIDWDALPIDRDASKPDPVYGGYYGNQNWARNQGWGGKRDWMDDDDRLFVDPPQPKPTPAKGKKGRKPKVIGNPLHMGPQMSVEQEMDDMNYQDLLALAQSAPATTALLLADLLVELKKANASVKTLRKLLGFDDPTYM